MYDVSSPFLDALAGPTLRTRVSGALTLNDSTTVSLSDASFLDGSLTVSNQCSEGSEIKLGGVYVGQLDCTLLKPGFSRSLLRGATISLSAGLLTVDGWEDVPLGVWTVGSATWSRAGVAITAYDAMSLLDADCSATAADAEPYDLLSKACDACGVTLSDSRDRIRSLPNGAGTYNLSADNDIDSWRDWVSWVAQLLGGFATIDRSGGLHVGSYGTDSVIDLSDTMRTSDSTVEDYETRYTGMSVVWQTDSTTRYYSVSPDDGLTYDLGTNPWLQSSDTGRDTHMTELVSAFSLVESTPMGVTIPGIPFLDLGDMVTLTGGLGLDARSNVMNVSWTPHKGVTLTAYGSDPGLSSAKSKTDKDISGLLSTVDQNTVAMYAFTNDTDVDCADGGSSPLATVSYTARKDTLAVVHVNIDLTVAGTIETSDGTTTWHPTTVTFTFQVDDVALDRTSVLTLDDGPQVAHLMLALDADADSTKRLEVTVSASGGSAHVEAGGAHGLVEGVGLAARQGWNGILEHEDSFTVVGLDRSLAPRDAATSVDAATQTPTPVAVGDGMDPVAFTRSLTPRTMTAAASPMGSETVDALHLSQATVDSGTVGAAGGLVVASAASQVTSWLMGRDVMVTGVAGAIVGGVTGDVTILASLDAAATWMAWDGSQWAESSTGMAAATFAGLDASAFTGFDPMTGIMLRIIMPAGSQFQTIGFDYTTQEDES